MAKVARAATKGANLQKIVGLGKSMAKNKQLRGLGKDEVTGYIEEQLRPSGVRGCDISTTGNVARLVQIGKLAYDGVTAMTAAAAKGTKGGALAVLNSKQEEEPLSPNINALFQVGNDLIPSFQKGLDLPSDFQMDIPALSPFLLANMLEQPEAQAYGAIEIQMLSTDELKSFDQEVAQGNNFFHIPQEQKVITAPDPLDDIFEGDFGKLGRSGSSIAKSHSASTQNEMEQKVESTVKPSPLRGPR